MNDNARFMLALFTVIMQVSHAGMAMAMAMSKSESNSESEPAGADATGDGDAAADSGEGDSGEGEGDDADSGEGNDAAEGEGEGEGGGDDADSGEGDSAVEGDSGEGDSGEGDSAAEGEGEGGDADSGEGGSSSSATDPLHVEEIEYGSYLITLSVADANDASVSFSEEEQSEYVLTLTNPSDSAEYYTVVPGREINDQGESIFQSNVGWGISDANAATNTVSFSFNIIRNAAGGEAFQDDGNGGLTRGGQAFDIQTLVDFQVTVVRNLAVFDYANAYIRTVASADLAALETAIVSGGIGLMSEDDNGNIRGGRYTTVLAQSPDATNGNKLYQFEYLESGAQTAIALTTDYADGTRHGGGSVEQRTTLALTVDSLTNSPDKTFLDSNQDGSFSTSFTTTVLGQVIHTDPTTQRMVLKVDPSPLNASFAYIVFEDGYPGGFPGP